MPRPAKTVRRQIVNAGLEYKKGNRKEAYELWAKAAATRKEHHDAKNNKKQRAAAEAAATAEKSDNSTSE